MAPCDCASSPKEEVVEQPAVRRLGPSDEDEAVALICSSYRGSLGTEPEWMFHWCLGKELHTKRGGEWMTWIARFVYRQALRSDGVVLGVSLPSGALVAVCIARFVPWNWSSICGRAAEMWTAAKVVRELGRPPAYTRRFRKECGLGVRRRGNEILSVKEDAHPEAAPDAHCYIEAVAVAPEVQGCGLCSVLMREATRIADKRGLPCYLETNGSRNVEIFRRFGFVEKEPLELACPKDQDASNPWRQFFVMTRPLA